MATAAKRLPAETHFDCFRRPFMPKIVAYLIIAASCSTLFGCRQKFDYSPPKLEKSVTATPSEAKKQPTQDNGSDNKPTTDTNSDKTVAIQDTLPGPDPGSGSDLIAFDEF